MPGVASFLPIFFYTFFLYLFTQAELLETLPSRLKKFATLFLILFIPVIVSINEVSSFIGIAYRSSFSPRIPFYPSDVTQVCRRHPKKAAAT
jgi:hypothetical protein